MIGRVNQQDRWPFILRRIFIVTLWSLPALIAFYMMCSHWVPVPFWDEWDTPGAQLAAYYRGSLGFSDLFSQHNEHRLLFPRLVWLSMAILAGWDVRHEMVLTFCFVCLGSAGLYKLLQFSGGSAAGRALVFGTINLLLFSPRQDETFLVGAQGQTFVPTFALVCALLMNLSKRSLPAKTIVNAALAFVSTYSFGNGMLVWLLAFPTDTQSAANLPAGRPIARVFWRAGYLLTAASSIAFYFISYRHPSLSPPLVSPAAQSAAFVRFILVWIGSLFSVGAPAIFGIVLLLLFIGLTIAAIHQMRRTGAWQPYYPWIVLGSYSIISAAIAAVARLGFDYSMAGDARYTAFSAFFYIAIAALGFSVYAQAKGQALSVRIARLAGVVFLAVIIACWTITFKKERRLLRIFTHAWKHSLLVLRWSEAIPSNPEIALLSPYPLEETLSTIRTLAEHDVLRPRLVSHRLASAVNNRPNTDAASAGALDAISLQLNGHLAFQGWARLPEQARPADCVVLGVESSEGVWTPFCVAETGGTRPDVARRFGIDALARAGFSGEIPPNHFPRGDIVVRAWAIDLQNEQAFPIAGAVNFHLTANDR